MPKTHKVRPTALNRKQPKNKDKGQAILMDSRSQKKRKLSDSEGADEVANRQSPSPGLEDEAGDDPVVKSARTSKIRGKAIPGKASRNEHGSGKKPKTVLVPPKKSPSDVDDDQMTESSNIAAEESGTLVTGASATETGQPSKRPRPAATGEIQTSGNVSSSVAESSSASSSPVIPDFLQQKNLQDWSTNDVFTFLNANKNPQFGDEHIKVIQGQEVAGIGLLELTKTDLIDKPYHLKGGPAAGIDRLVKDLKFAMGLVSGSAPQEPLPKKARLHDGLIANQAPQEEESDTQMISDSTGLLARIRREASEDPSEYSNPTKILILPFPYPGRTKPIDRFSISATGFSYMGREKFQDVLKRIQRFDINLGIREIFVYGTIGYGKSHILAALACYLLRRKCRVVYLPDCRHFAKDPLYYIKSAFHLAFGDVTDTQHRKEIDLCNSLKNIEIFSKNVSKRGDILYFIIDQVNALDQEDTNKDDVSNDTKGISRAALDRIISTHYVIKSASANYKSAMYLEKKQNCVDLISLLGGMTKVEIQSWWEHHRKELPVVTDDEKEHIMDITGGIPLLLRPLLKYSKKSFKEVVSDFMREQEISTVIKEVILFAKTINAERNKMERQWFVKFMNDCIIHKVADVINPELYDHRYFYLDEYQMGHHVCGLARETVARYLRETGENNIPRPEWFAGLETFKDNPSMLGFIVEQICLSSISLDGLLLQSKKSKPLKTTVFSGLTATLNKSCPCELFIPQHYNFKAIDALMVICKELKAHIIPIQITINRNHSNSVASFFESWSGWANQLQGYDIEVTFVWIRESQGELTEKEQEVRETRKGLKVVSPKVSVKSISFADVNVELGDTFARLRGRS